MKPGIRTALTLAVDETFISDATLRNIPGFVFKVGANTSGKLKLWVAVFTGAVGGFKFLLLPVAGSPAGYIQQATVFTPPAAAVSVFATTLGIQSFPLPSVSGGLNFLQVEVYLTGGATGVTYQLQMAQDTADAQQLSIIAGSSIEYLQL